MTYQSKWICALGLALSGVAAAQAPAPMTPVSMNRSANLTVQVSQPAADPLVIQFEDHAFDFLNFRHVDQFLTSPGGEGQATGTGGRDIGNACMAAAGDGMIYYLIGVATAGSAPCPEPWTPAIVSSTAHSVLDTQFRILGTEPKDFILSITTFVTSSSGTGDGSSGAALALLLSGPEGTLFSDVADDNNPDEPKNIAGTFQPGVHQLYAEMLATADVGGVAPRQEGAFYSSRAWVIGHLFIEPLVVFDPNPDLMSDGQITTDPDRLLYNQSRKVNGLTADGVTKVIVRFKTPSAGQVAFTLTESATGTLSRLDGSGAGTSVTVNTVTANDGRFGAVAVLTAPEDFVSSPADVTQAARPCVVRGVFTPATGGGPITFTRTLSIVRPPVVLIHGIWSSGDAWKWGIKSDPRFLVGVVDYRLSNARPLYQNHAIIRPNIRAALKRIRDLGFAATQVDLVTHSMGGLLSRIYIGGPDCRRPDNFRQGDVNRLITLCTPHIGSPWCTALFTVSGPGAATGPVFRKAFRAAGFPVDEGAIEDMRPESGEILYLPACPVPSHAVIAKGGSDILQAGLEGLLPAPTRALIELARWIGLLGPDIFPPALQHDMVVGRTSQEGRLDAGQVSVVGLVFPAAWSIHITVLREALSNDTVVQLLNTALADPVYAAAGFPAAPPPFRWDAEGSTSDQPAAIERGSEPPIGLIITQPASGTVVAPGASITVTAAPTNGFAPEGVFFTNGMDGVLDDTAPFSATLEIPMDAVGDLAISAFALDDAGAGASAVPVEIQVTPTATLTGITIEPDIVEMSSIIRTTGIVVHGIYSDGILRDVTASGAGTTLSSSDEGVASIDDRGEVTAHGLGQATITATDGAFTAEATVVVSSLFGDVDGDGYVGYWDWRALRACFSGPWQSGGFVMPDVTSRDVFDADHDYDIDLDDADAFFAVYGDFLDDCNQNELADLRDIISGASQDANDNDVPDECERPPCPADLDGDGMVGSADLAQALGAWGEAGPADLNSDGAVGSADLAFILGSWGPCP